VPLFMDRHDVPGATAQDVAEAHMSDIEKSQEYGVQFISYWFDAEAGGVFCFAKAPSRDTLEAVHNASHGLVPNEIISVSQDDVFRFLGSVNDPKTADELTSPFRAIMFTDLVGSTAILETVGETRFVELLSTHDGIVREALYRHRGSEVKHTGDGIMASFDDVDNALRCALAVGAAFSNVDLEKVGLKVRIGLAAGHPVMRNDDIYGEAVVLASRLCDAATPAQILVASTVRDHCTQSYDLVGPRSISLKGFVGPVEVFELRQSAEPSAIVAPTAPRPSVWSRIFGRNRARS
jgi:class 3 adenylate cyclase